VRRFHDLIEEATQRPFSGWDVSYDGRIWTDAPWDFGAFVDAFAQASPDLLDMGTGGGEWLSQRRHLPARTVATEGWGPNIPIARARLEPLGIRVLGVTGAPDNLDQEEGVEGGDLPFDDGSFHLVTNRHESFAAHEVARILAPGGHFLTQQVASHAAEGFYRLLGQTPPAAPGVWDLALAVKQVTSAGFVVEEQDEGFEVIHFADVGALAWYLKNLPFVIPGFSISSTIGKLRTLHEELSAEGALSIPQPLFRLTARKPVPLLRVREASAQGEWLGRASVPARRSFPNRPRRIGPVPRTPR